MTDAELAIVVKLKDLFSKQLDSIVANTDKSAVRMEKAWGKLTNMINTAKGALIAAGVFAFRNLISNISETAMKVDLARTAFKNLTQTIGIDAVDALKLMREASQKTVSDLNLMEITNKLLMYGSIKSAEELKKIAEYGTKLGTAMGITAAEGIEKFGTALSTQNVEMLRAVGIVLKTTDILDKLGEKTERLGENTKEAFKSAIFDTAAQQMAKLGKASAQVALSIQQSAVATENLKQSIAMGVMDTVAKIEKGKGVTDYTARAFENINERPGRVSWELPEPALEQAKAYKERQALYQQMEADQKAALLDSLREEFKQSVKDDEALTAGYYERFINEQAAFLGETKVPVQEVKTYMDTVWEGMADGAKKYYASISDVMINVSDCIYDTFRSIEYNLGDVFFDAMMGKMKTFKDYMRAFVQDIARMMSQLMARQALGSLLGAVGGLFGGGAAAGSPGQIEPSPGYSFGAEGNLGAGVEFFQHGGITHGPAIAGEAGPEAVVPLPSSRAIPVEFKNGSRGATNITYVINAIDSQSFAQALLQSRTSIHRIVAEGFSADQQLRSAVRAV